MVTNPDREKFKAMRWGCSAYFKNALLVDAVENDLTVDEELLTADCADGRRFFGGLQDKYGALKVENASLGALMMVAAIGKHEKNLGVKE